MFSAGERRQASGSRKQQLVPPHAPHLRKCHPVQCRAANLCQRPCRLAVAAGSRRVQEGEPAKDLTIISPAWRTSSRCKPLVTIVLGVFCL